MTVRADNESLAETTARAMGWTYRSFAMSYRHYQVGEAMRTRKGSIGNRITRLEARFGSIQKSATPSDDVIVFQMCLEGEWKAALEVFETGGSQLLAQWRSKLKDVRPESLADTSNLAQLREAADRSFGENWELRSNIAQRFLAADKTGR